MTKMKLCGLFRPCDIDAANELKPEYIGFVFAPKSRRYVTPEEAAELKKLLAPDIQAVGVFVNEVPERIAAFLNKGIIDIAQLHGVEDENEINQLRALTDKWRHLLPLSERKNDYDESKRTLRDSRWTVYSRNIDECSD